MLPAAYAVAIRVRPMTPDDVQGAWSTSQAAFQALGDRWPASRQPEALRARRAIDRVAYLCDHDPDGAWIAEERGRVVGVAQAIVREGLWGLSLLAVDPGRQGSGCGRALLDAALSYADGTRGQVVLSSTDPRAMRAYARAGFALHPTVCAFGIVPRESIPGGLGVREGRDRDLDLAAAVDRSVRGSAHGEDLERLREAEGRFLVVPDRGYVIHNDGSPALLAALDEQAARALLWAALGEAPAGHEVGVMFLTAAQGWAVDVALLAGLQLELGGPTFVRGRLGPLTPYLPNPAYL
jgi:GNAT superfamily N-acetyltransferase